MTKIEFGELFERSLSDAAGIAEKKTGRSIPQEFEILLFGAGLSGSIMTVAEAAEVLFLAEDFYYLIVDLSVVKVANGKCLVFTRVSDHKPSNFDSTWNDPIGDGPFKQIEAKEIVFE